MIPISLSMQTLLGKNDIMSISSGDIGKQKLKSCNIHIMFYDL